MWLIHDVIQSTLYYISSYIFYLLTTNILSNLLLAPLAQPGHLVEENFEWNSDDDNDDGVDTKDVVDECNRGIYFLGFHPFREIIFLERNLSRGLAYNLNTSKIQDLGNLCPKYYGDIAGPRGLIEASFPYTPCWMK